MQKTFLKFVVFELVEKIARFRLLLNECADQLHERSPGLYQTLLNEAGALEEKLFSQKTLLNKLFAESGKQESGALDPALWAIYDRLIELSRVLLQLQQLDIEPETYLFLKDALPTELTKDAGEQSVFLAAEGDASSPADALLSGVLMDWLPLLQKNNPLAWVGLTRAYSRHLAVNASSLEALKLDVLKTEKKKAHGADEPLVDALMAHAVNLRLLGPAYYFQALSDAVFARDDRFLHFVEPALFYGLNHQNFSHKSLVILHEACERAKPDVEALAPLGEDTLSALFRAVEKLVPGKAAFQEKHLDRAVQLQERLSQGVLLSSTPMFPVDEVVDALEATRDLPDFSIYDTLTMMTEYPHTPREIVNAGWLHKVERGPVWLYSTLNETDNEGFARVLDLIDYQDHLLRKSIEVSEVHRVLVCS